jgi:hypothetical protein
VLQIYVNPFLLWKTIILQTLQTRLETKLVIEYKIFQNFVVFVEKLFACIILYYFLFLLVD